MLLDDLGRAPRNPTLHEKLSELFYNLSRSGEYKVRDALEEKIQGLEVIPVGDKQGALTVCGEGHEIRVLVGNRGGFLERKSLQREWRSFASGRIAGATNEPTSCRILALSSAYLNSQKGWDSKTSTLHLTSALLKIPEFDRPLGEPQFSRSGDVIVFAVIEGTDSGIWKLEPHSEPVKIRDGYFASPVIRLTSDDIWVNAQDNKLWFTDLGYLLRMPLPKTQNTQK